MKSSSIQGKSFKIDDFEFIDYEDQLHRQAVVQVVAEAYLFNNPQFKELNLSKEEMMIEVEKQIDNNEYCALTVHKESGEIAALGFFSESHRYRSKNQLDITKCPTKDHIRLYLRNASIEGCLENLNFPKGVCCFSNGFTITRKFMGQNMGDILTFCLLEKFQAKGFKYCLGNAINEKAKYIFRKMHSESINVVDVGKLTILETGEKPYAGKNLLYETFLIDLPGTRIKTEARLRDQARL